MSDTLLVAIIAAIVGAVSSIGVALITRPKVNAEAKAAHAGGEVALSGDAREWAHTFQKQANDANARADRAEAKADETERKCDELERRFNLLASEYGSLQREVIKLGGHPKAPHPDLVPPLTVPAEEIP